MSRLSTMLDRSSRHALSFIVLGVALTACGGGGGDSATALTEGEGVNKTPETTGPVSTLPVSTEPCPADYRKISISDSSLPGATMNLKAGQATFSLSTPKIDPLTSLQACFGLPSGQLAQTGYQVLSDTYEVKVTTASAAVSASTALADLKPKLAIKFALTGLPTGLSAAELANKINVYSPDDKGVWQTLTMPVVDIETEPVGEAASTITVSPTVSGQFVVAYKP